MMRNKLFSGFTCILTIFVVISSFSVKSDAYTVGEVQSLIDGIVGYKLETSGANSVQEWIDNELTENAGISSEWYIIALSQSRSSYDFSSYEAALDSYLSRTNVASATSRQKYAIAFIAAGSSNAYISKTLDNSIGMQGIMSWIFGLHLLNNGYTCGSYTAEDIVNKLISMQLGDGGWAISGNVSDVDVTSMAVQALAPYYSENRAAVDSAVALLSQRQLEDGDYSSYGVPNPESTAQVITALSSLGIDCLSDTRFIKNGNSLLDGIEKYRIADGSFSHTMGGASNNMATVQVFYSLISYTRQQNGWGSLYIFDNRNPARISVSTNAPDIQAPVQSNQQNTPALTQPKSPDADTVTTAGTAAVSSTEAQTSTALSISSETDSKSSDTEKMAFSGSKSESGETSVETSATKTIKPSENSDGDGKSSSSGGYKVWVSLIIAAAGGLTCMVLLIIGKRHSKNFIAVIIAAGVGVGFVCLTDFQSAEDYYNSESIVKENAIGTVTMTIRCDTITEKSDAEYVPEDGCILDVTEFSIEQGDTVFDVLTEAAQTYGIQMEYNGSTELAYVSGINYLYEFDFGDLSGWVYHVNGVAPSIGCGEYVLNDGDVVEWHYTCDLGNDVK